MPGRRRLVVLFRHIGIAKQANGKKNAQAGQVKDDQEGQGNGDQYSLRISRMIFMATSLRVLLPSCAEGSRGALCV